MKRKFLLIAVLALAACGKQGDESSSLASSTAQAPAERHATVDRHKPTARKLVAPLPEGLVLGFANELRNDRLVRSKSGTQRRKVAFEYLQGDQESVFESIDASLQAAGFKSGGRTNLDNGNIRVKFTKPKFGRITVVVTPSITKPRNPQAIGVVTLDMPVPASMQ